jgi:hypothetical protein
MLAWGKLLSSNLQGYNSFIYLPHLRFLALWNIEIIMLSSNKEYEHWKPCVFLNHIWIEKSNFP